MDISILGYKLNVEVLILIGIVYLILVSHMFCGCCNFGVIETFVSNVANDIKKKQDTKTNLPTQSASGLKEKDVEPVTHMVSTTTSKEGFTGANLNYGETSVYDLKNEEVTDTSSWFSKNLSVVKGAPLSDGVKAFLDRPKQPIPLPEGEMLLFAKTPFKPECCPNTYTNGNGCACMTGEQYNWLGMRGGNNVPYSQY